MNGNQLVARLTDYIRNNIAGSEMDRELTEDEKTQIAGEITTFVDNELEADDADDDEDA